MPLVYSVHIVVDVVVVIVIIIIIITSEFESIMKI